MAKAKALFLDCFSKRIMTILSEAKKILFPI